MTDEHEPPGGLQAIVGAILGFTAIIMGPVPFIGMVFSALGLVFSLAGRRSEFGGSARIGIWLNAIGLTVGTLVTAWFAWHHLRN